ncbi:unnamed protein product [Allacma fusca]|uniref:Uncharacterized protein n=1 Tax=Allacma fusca TaxID=39272 RepID=A0A8J2Q718_9HEXA|nr:unnamed protein product [Allacma fusca]
MRILAFDFGCIKLLCRNLKITQNRKISYG